MAATAQAIGEPARVHMLSLLLDGSARSATELALAAGVTPSTASTHLQRLESSGLLTRAVQGKHHYFRLASADAARALEALGVLAGAAQAPPARVPGPMRSARTCYDHIAGRLGVALHDRLFTLGWLDNYQLTPAGRAALQAWGIDTTPPLLTRRRFAFACLDWSERRPHLAGALGAGLLAACLRQRWLRRQLDSRVLEISPAGRRHFAQLGLLL